MKNSKRPIKHNSGFTVFELVTVIAIIAIASAIAVPGIISWRQNAKMKSAVNSIYGDLQYAKFSAIKTNSWVAVRFYTNRYEIFFDGDNDQTQDASEQTLKNVSMPSGVTIDSTTFISNRTGFDRRGLPVEATLEVATRTGKVNLLGPSALSRQITINRLGRLN